MYNNRVLIGNWYEERNGNFVFQKYGNIDTTYQNDYPERILPLQDHTFTWKIKETALGLPIELFREHGVHNAYKNNMSSLYDINCMSAYNKPLARCFSPIYGGWKPTQDFTVNYGPGRSELVKRKRESWISDHHKFSPITEYQCNYTTK